MFEPLDFIANLAALVPKSRVNLTRFHGVFVEVQSVTDKILKYLQDKGAFIASIASIA
jgi:hypothetical protein